MCTELLNRNTEGANFPQSTGVLCDSIERFVQDVDGDRVES